MTYVELRNIEHARTYVGTTPVSGLVQLALLNQVWFDPRQGVLEIGCGALHLAKPLLALPGITYVGVDPNLWLRDLARQNDPDLAAACLADRVLFRSGSDFYGWPPPFPCRDRAGIAFSHSVLTHCSQEQLAQFMGALWSQADRALVSVNFGAHTTAHRTAWTYPECVQFSPEAVFAAADDAGWRTAEVRPDLRAFYMAYCPDEPHRWLYLSR